MSKDANQEPHPPSLKVTLEECYSGTKKKIKLYGNKVCTECFGVGYTDTKVGGTLSMKKSCHRCNGSTEIADRSKFEILQVFVPAGSKDGDELVLNNKTNKKVLLKVKEHAVLTRKGDDLWVHATVKWFDALLGRPASIPHASGNNLWVVFKRRPRETISPGSIWSLDNMGMPSTQHSRHGKMYIVVRLAYPTKVSKDVWDLLDKKYPCDNANGADHVHVTSVRDVAKEGEIEEEQPETQECAIS